MTKFADKVALRAYFAVKSFFKDEKGDVNVVSIVVLIGIALALAIAFRGAITDVLEVLFGGIMEDASSVGGPVTINP